MFKIICKLKYYCYICTTFNNFKLIYMKKEDLQIVSFDQAKRLEIAGFDLETDKLYCKPFLDRPEYIIPNDSGITEHYLLYAPTVSIALKWLIDVKNISGDVSMLDISNESALLDELLTLLETK